MPIRQSADSIEFSATASDIVLLHNMPRTQHCRHVEPHLTDAPFPASSSHSNCIIREHELAHVDCRRLFRVSNLLQNKSTKSHTNSRKTRLSRHAFDRDNDHQQGSRQGRATDQRRSRETQYRKLFQEEAVRGKNTG